MAHFTQKDNKIVAVMTRLKKFLLYLAFSMELWLKLLLFSKHWVVLSEQKQYERYIYLIFKLIKHKFNNGNNFITSNSIINLFNIYWFRRVGPDEKVAFWAITPIEELRNWPQSEMNRILYKNSSEKTWK
jgi:hypothetical protein